jgi:rare lipoprotein A
VREEKDQLTATDVHEHEARARRSAAAWKAIVGAGFAGLVGLGLAGCSSHRTPVGWAPPEGTTAVGVASWYGPGFNGKRTASGERFDQEGLTAAHRLWAFGTQVRVTLLSTNRSVVVTINDRMPRKDRVIDLSKGAARRIGLIGPGIGRVRLEVVEEAPPRAPVKRAVAGG